VLTDQRSKPSGYGFNISAWDGRAYIHEKIFRSQIENARGLPGGPRSKRTHFYSSIAEAGVNESASERPQAAGRWLQGLAAPLKYKTAISRRFNLRCRRDREFEVPTRRRSDCVRLGT
jgi:hypothetical protein